MPQTDKAFVFIIESPSEDDLLDGRTEGRALHEMFRLSGTVGWYSLITSRNMFYQVLNKRLPEALQCFSPKLPIIHLSMHGNTDGIELTNGDYITWDELRIALAPLNNAMSGGLLICMSSCFGSSGCRMAMHEDNERPFWALVGSTSSPSWENAAVAYITFYHQFFKQQSVENAVHKMNVASGEKSFIWHYGKDVQQGWTSHVNQLKSNALVSALMKARKPNDTPESK